MSRSTRHEGELPPGSVIGVLGSGQLGRMLALAAAPLGYETHVFAPSEGPATQVTGRRTLAAYDDHLALLAFADAVDVITCEFENVPGQVFDVVGQRAPVRPGERALRTCQERVAEKSLLGRLGVPTAPWVEVENAEELAVALAHVGGDGILKTNRLGYDGKGQASLRSASEAASAWATAMGHAPGISGVLEGRIDFACEISVVVARSLRGGTVAYPPVRNDHADGILRTTVAPADLDARLAEQATSLAVQVAEALEIVGLLAVEMFVGNDGCLRVNELAARPHNSGHWTQDGCVTSQFEQCVRAICGLPLGSVDLVAPTVMHNLIGEEVRDLAGWMEHPRAHVHLYGKEEVRPGRKMGHVNVVG